MICSTCGTDVEEYYHGRQCKPCRKKPQIAWWKKRENRDRAEVYRIEWRKNHRGSCIQAVAKCRKKHRVLYNIHSKLKSRYHRRYLTDVYIRKRVRQLLGLTHIVTDQEIDERRQQIIGWREKRMKKQKSKKEPMVFCPMVKREILLGICRNVQVNYLKNCHEDCEHREKD